MRRNGIGGSKVDGDRRRQAQRTEVDGVAVAFTDYFGDCVGLAGVGTAEDVGVAAGLSEIGSSPSSADYLDEGVVSWALDRIHEMIERSVARMKVDALPIPLIAVGGGAFLVPDSISGIGEVIRLEHGGVANAVGAAIAQVSGEVDQVFSGLGREEALERASSIARDRAISAGADPEHLHVVDIEDLPLAYLPGDARRVRVKVVGETVSS